MRGDDNDARPQPVATNTPTNSPPPPPHTPPPQTKQDPKKRPSCTTLLAHKYFAKRSKDALVSELLDRIESVGEGELETAPRLPGTGPAYISQDGQSTLRAGARRAAEAGEGEGDNLDTVRAGGGGGKKAPKLPSDEGEFVRGTTWVFDDGSQVILKDGEKGKGGGGDDDEFYREFEAMTKGENFKGEEEG